jgi:integrin beta 3
MSEPARTLVDAIKGYIDPALDELHKRIDSVPAVRDGRDGRDGAKGEDGQNGRDGAAGQDGLGFDDLSVEHDGERTVILRFARGDQAKEFPVVFPVPIYRDVYRPEKSYVRGDVVTFGGSMWHCNAATEDKPGDGSAAWTLAAKRGRDGRNGKEPTK